VAYECVYRDKMAKFTRFVLNLKFYYVTNRRTHSLVRYGESTVVTLSNTLPYTGNMHFKAQNANI